MRFSGFCQLTPFLLLLLSMPGISGQITREDPASDPGFIHFYNNEFDEAISYFEAQVKAFPEDPDRYNHLAQSILYRELFRDGALESELIGGTNPFLRRPKMRIGQQEQARFDECIDRALKLSEASLNQNPQNTRALYALGVAHGLRANYLFLAEKAWVDSLREATSARKANERILEIDPNFVDAHLILGLNKYVVGCLPFYMRALGFIGGFHGDKEAGIRELEFVRTNGVLDRYDAQILLAAIYRRERRPQNAIPLLEQAAHTFPRNYLFRFEQVEMYSDLGNKTAALRVLDEIDQLRRCGAPGYARLWPEKLDYLRGNLLFWYGDLDPALTNLERATQRATVLDQGTAVMGWLRLGQVYDLRGNHRNAIQAYQEAINAAPQSEAASQAKQYIASPYRRKHVPA